MPALDLPDLYTARYFAPGVLTSGEVVPVSISFEPPIVPLPYETVRGPGSVLPEFWMWGEWRDLSRAYWRKLDGVGVDVVARELGGISESHDGRPLALLDYEDLEKGHRSHRVTFAAWWEEHTGRPVYELTKSGERLHHTELHKQVRPKRPKVWREDRRWRDVAVGGWPLSREEVAGWIGGRYWQFARTMKHNPHEYTHRSWGDERSFELVVLFIREHGEQEWYGRAEYTYLVVGDHKYWTMGDSLPSTVILNRKRLGQDGGEAGDRATQPRLSEPTGKG